jgi:hypothetical protein
VLVGDSQSYPVFVEETVVRMIWVEADSPEAAAKKFSEYPGSYDYGRGGGDPVDGWVTGIAPSEQTSRYDWDAVYGYTGAADDHDSHVAMHQHVQLQQRRAECAADGHPQLEDRGHGLLWCPNCTDYIKPAPTSERG